VSLFRAGIVNLVMEVLETFVIIAVGNITQRGPGMKPKELNMSFETELCQLLNRYSGENDSNTPDFILCQYIITSLAAFNTAVQQRETWYGRDARPSAQLNEEAGDE